MNVLSRKALCGLLAMLMLVGVSVTFARAQVLNQVPEDALVVIRIKNIQVTSDKVGKLFKDLGLAAMQPGLDNPLGYVQKEMKLTNGVNTAGDFAFVMRDSSVTNQPGDRSMFMLVPVTDYAAFVGNFEGATPDGDVTEVTMPKSSEKGYVAKWGDFAALSPSKEVVSLKPSATLKITGEAANKDLAGRDIVVFANMKAIRTKALPALAGAKDEAIAEFEKNLPQDEKLTKLRPAIKAFIGQLFVAMEGFLRDTDAATFTVNFGDDGINFGVMAEFVPGSYLDTNLASMKNTDAPMMRGLPTGKYLMFGGSINPGEQMEKLFNDFSTPVLKELDAIGPEMQPAHDYVDSLTAYLKANTGSSFGLLAPSGNIGQESIIQVVSVSQGDAKAMKAAQLKMANSQTELMKALGFPADAYNNTHTPNAKTVDGVTFDSLVTAVNRNSNDPVVRQQAAIMDMLYGADGVNVMFGEVGADRMMMVMGVNDATLAGAVAAAKSNESTLSNQAIVKQVAAKLPQNRTGEFYIAVDQIVATGLNYARQFGAPLNIQLQPDLPPVGFAGSTDGTAVRMDGFVPTALVQQLVSAGMQAFMQMQGGGDGNQDGKL